MAPSPGHPAQPTPLDSSPRPSQRTTHLWWTPLPTAPRRPRSGQRPRAGPAALRRVQPGPHSHPKSPAPAPPRPLSIPPVHGTHRSIPYPRTDPSPNSPSSALSPSDSVCTKFSVLHAACAASTSTRQRNNPGHRSDSCHPPQNGLGRTTPLVARHLHNHRGEQPDIRAPAPSGRDRSSPASQSPRARLGDDSERVHLLPAPPLRSALARNPSSHKHTHPRLRHLSAHAHRGALRQRYRGSEHPFRSCSRGVQNSQRCRSCCHRCTTPTGLTHPYRMDVLAPCRNRRPTRSPARRPHTYSQYDDAGQIAARQHHRGYAAHPLTDIHPRLTPKTQVLGNS